MAYTFSEKYCTSTGGLDEDLTREIHGWIRNVKATGISAKGIYINIYPFIDAWKDIDVKSVVAEVVLEWLKNKRKFDVKLEDIVIDLDIVHIKPKCPRYQ